MVYLRQTKNHNLLIFYTSQRGLAVPEALIISDTIYRYCIYLYNSQFLCIPFELRRMELSPAYQRISVSEPHSCVKAMVYWCLLAETSHLFSTSKDPARVWNCHTISLKLVSTMPVRHCSLGVWCFCQPPSPRLMNQLTHHKLESVSWKCRRKAIWGKGWFDCQLSPPSG